MSQVVFFRVEATGVADLVDQLGLLRREAKQLQADMSKATDPTEYLKLNRALEQNRSNQKEITAAIRENTKATKDAATMQVGSYRALDKELANLRRSYKELGQAEREGVAGKETLKRIQVLDTQMKQLDATMGQFQRNVGNYPGGDFGASFKGLIQQAGGPLGNFVGQVEGLAGPLGGMASSLGFAGAAAGAAAGAIAGVGLVAAAGVAKAMEYETAFAQLSATLGVSGDEADVLKERISELQTITLDNGASIVSTNASIADSLTVVGSAAPQLLKNQDALAAVTREVIIFSKSAGTDMAEAARVVTGAMNLFGLEASQAARIVNVLAAGEKEGSATTLEAAAALEEAGGAAKLSGISIEETTAAIQLLAKDSLKGSEAGNGLKNVLLTLATASELPKAAQEGLGKALQGTGKDITFFQDKNVALVDKLQLLKNISGDTAAMTAIFGRENINAAISLTKYADEFPALTQAITDTDVAYDQAGVKQATFAAKLENLTNSVTNLLTKIGEALLPVLSYMADYFMAIVGAATQVGTAIGDVVEEVGSMIGETDLLGKILKGVGDLFIFIATVPFKAFRLAVLNVGAVLSGLGDVVSGIPQYIREMAENSIARLQIFTLKAKGLFQDASNFISLGFASGGEEYYAQADALYNDLQKRTADQKGLFEMFGAGYMDFINKATEKDNARQVAAEQAIKAEQQQLDMAQKLEAQAEADAEKQKERDAAAKKAAEEKKKADEEAAKQAEIERRNLAFLREELAKVEEKLKGYTDKNLIPTALLQSYNSLKNEIANVEKELADLFKAAEPIKIPVEIDETSIQKIQGDLIDIQKMTAKEAYKSAKAVADAGKKDEKSAKEDAQKRLDEEKDLREQIKEASIQLAQDASDAIFELEAENAERRLEKRLEEIDQQESEQLALVEGNAIAEQQVLEQFAAQREQLQREEFERKKRMDIAQAIMNGALGVTSALTQVPAGFVMAALVAAQTAIQVATIAAQQFARGGLIEGEMTPRAEHGIFVGPSHAGGGINTRLSGRRVNVEGGEYFERLRNGSTVVINKRSTSRFRDALLGQAGRDYPGKLQTLSGINQYGGGVPLFAMGGLVPTMGNASVDPNQNVQLQLLAASIDKLSNRVPVLTVQSYDTVNARANQVKTLQGL